MTNYDAYELNIAQRLNEIRRGDPAYKLHEYAIAEAMIVASDVSAGKLNLHGRILDVGCGLGFMASAIQKSFKAEVVGIDPSQKSIEIARKEHQNCRFHLTDAQKFPSQMPNLDESPFEIALLNMILHSVDDNEALAILAGVRQSLKPEGAVILIAPTARWLIQKLVEYAQDKDMPRESGIDWVQKKLLYQPVQIQVKISDGEYYESPLTIYNRQPTDYASLLRRSNFGVGQEIFSQHGEHVRTDILPYLRIDDYLSNFELQHRLRMTFTSFSLPDEYHEIEKRFANRRTSIFQT